MPGLWPSLQRAVGRGCLLTPSLPAPIGYDCVLPLKLTGPGSSSVPTCAKVKETPRELVAAGRMHSLRGAGRAACLLAPPRPPFPASWVPIS